jgi:hypothetical protein
MTVKIKPDDVYTRQVPSEKYETLLKEYIEMHQSSDKMFNGKSLLKFANVIQHVLRENNCKTLLDYGSGKGQLYTDEYKKISDELPAPLPQYWGLEEYTLYDPAFEEYSTLPYGGYDAVVSTDVLEHVPEEDLGWVVEEILDYSKKIVFLNISCMEAVKTFKDGSNVHVSVFNPVTWAKFIADKLSNVKRKNITVYLYTDYRDSDTGQLLNKIYKIKYSPTIYEIKE